MFTEEIKDMRNFANHCEFQRAQWKVWDAEERERNGVRFGMLERSVGDKAPC